MKEKILKILKNVPSKMCYDELIKCCIEDDLSISDFIALYEEYYKLIDMIFEVLEGSEDAETENNKATNETRD